MSDILAEAMAAAAAAAEPQSKAEAELLAGWEDEAQAAWLLAAKAGAEAEAVDWDSLNLADMLYGK